MPLTYPGRTFSGSKNPSEWFGNVTPAEDTRWKPRAAAEGGGMPRAGYIPEDMWASIKRQAPGDLADVEDAPPPPPARFGGSTTMRPSMMGLRGAATPQQQWIAERKAADAGQGNDVNLNVALGAEIAKGRALRDIEARRKDPMLGIGSSYDPQQALYDTQFPWAPGKGGMNPVQYAILGKGAAMGKQIRADLPGRLKGYDPVVGRTIDLEGGERPAASYTNEEQDYIMSSGPALNALRRASGYNRPVLPR